MRTEVFRARDIKMYDEGLPVLDGLSMNLYEGEILGVFGTFDSGRTTLHAIITGKSKPVSGTRFYYGEPLTEKNILPTMVEIGRDSTLIPQLSVWENMIVVREHRTKSILNPSGAIKAVQMIIDEYGLQINPAERTERLTSVEVFIIELIKACLRKAKIILVDDFTLHCTPKEHQMVMHVLRKITKDGTSILLTGNRIELLKPYVDRLGFLYGGKIVRTVRMDTCGYELEQVFQTLYPQNVKDARMKRTDDAVLSIYGLISNDILDRVDVCSGEIVTIVDRAKFLMRYVRRRFVPHGIFYRVKTKDVEQYIQIRKRNAKIIILHHDTLNIVNDNLSAVENICLGIPNKLSRFGVIRRETWEFIKREFDEWYGSDCITSRQNCAQLSRHERIAIALFRLRLLKPDVIIGINLASETDTITGELLRKCIMEHAEGGAAVCLLTSGMEKQDEYADRYYIVPEHTLFT